MSVRAPNPERVAAREWLTLSVAVLVIAGLFALLLVAGRMPPFDAWVTDPAFFRKALVVHVDLALVCWFVSFAAGLTFLLPARGKSSRLSRHGPRIATAGVAILVAVPAVFDVEPVLSNYVPVLDHPAYIAGLVIFAIGVLVSVLDARLLPSAEPGFVDIPSAARPGLRAVALGLLITALTLFGAVLTRPVGTTPEVFYELVFWGPGHVLQLVSVFAMVTCWIVLLGATTQQTPLSRSTSSLLFGALLFPWLASPVLAMQGTTSAIYRTGFTSLMRWAIFPAVLLFLGVMLARSWRALPSRWWVDPRAAGLVVSVVLTLLGFFLGFCIRGSNTIIPAHYHASIGAVTAAFMAMTWLLLGPVGLSLPSRARRATAVQPVLFGVGQVVFAAGFAVAGAYGMGRKVYGAEQAVRSLPETLGLAVMGIGGLVAAVGGVLFLALFVAAWRNSHAVSPVSTGGSHGIAESAHTG